MTLFFFDLVKPSERERDDVGVDFSHLEQAYLEACRAAIEISKDALLQRQDPYRYRFEVFDEERRLLLEIPFREVLRPSETSLPPPVADLFEKVRRNIRRSETLKAELAEGFNQARRSLMGMRELMRNGAGDGSPPTEEGPAGD